MKRIEGWPAALSGCLVAALACLLMAGTASGEHSGSRFSRAEITWATTWINSALPKFMHKGIIAKISTRDDSFQVFAGKPWYNLSFTQQGEFLKNLARAREITGHLPAFSVMDIDSSETVARVSWQTIEILTPAEGFKMYIPPDEEPSQPSQPSQPPPSP